MTTVRTIKLKRSSQAYGDTAGSSSLSAPEAIPETHDATPPSPPEQSGASAPLTPEAAPQVSINTVSSKSTVWFMLIALAAVLGLLIILGLQYSEKSFYKETPSVWLPGK